MPHNGGTTRNMTHDKIAILILAHKNPEQLAKLIKKFDDERFDTFVHVDAKSRMPFIAPEMLHSTCYVLEKSARVKTYLNDFTLIEATMQLVKAAFAHSEYKYYILLTGQDYPIKSKDAIYSRLLREYPTCWIDSYGLEDAKKHGMNWVEHIGHKRFSQRTRRVLQRMVGNKFYFSPYGKLIKIFAVSYDYVMSRLRKSPRQIIEQLGYIYSSGSHFWMLPDIAIKHLIEIYKKDTTLNDVFRHAAAPEESYFQTSLSSFHKAIIPNPYTQMESIENEMDNPALRLIKWYENGVHTSGHPADWQPSDFSTIANANALFARKFSGEKQILDLIDMNLR